MKDESTTEKQVINMLTLRICILRSEIDKAEKALKRFKNKSHIIANISEQMLMKKKV
jgi:hypothetical protein